ncbi:MarR family transcriptional regulator [Candidatus Daviesbacteria bacterium]|nr:MarR family transcriptional regulator [Candidatus Daviesbacteria bacterium]
MKHTFLFHTVNLGKKFQKCIDFDLAFSSLSYSQSSALLFINSKKEVSQKQIAQTLNLEPATVVVLIDELEDLDLVKRESVNDDRRKYKITLTSKGKKIVKQILDRATKLDEFLKARLSAKEAQCFYLTLEKLDQSLEDWKGGEK